MSEWIKCSERLPAYFESVLSVRDGRVFNMYFNGDSWKFDGFGHPEINSFEDVTHWQPLPPPPAE